MVKDIWQSLTEDLKINCVNKKLNDGLYCFKILKVSEPIKINIPQHKTKHYTYKMHFVNVRSYMWRNPRFDNMYFKIRMSNKVLLKIASIRLKFQEYKIPIPELILLYKNKNENIIFTFVYECIFNEYKPILRECSIRAARKHFYWMGNTLTFDETEWLRWYKNEQERINKSYNKLG